MVAGTRPVADLRHTGAEFATCVSLSVANASQLGASGLAVAPPALEFPEHDASYASSKAELPSRSSPMLGTDIGEEAVDRGGAGRGIGWESRAQRDGLLCSRQRLGRADPAEINGYEV